MIGHDILAKYIAMISLMRENNLEKSWHQNWVGETNISTLFEIAEYSTALFLPEK